MLVIEKFQQNTNNINLYNLFKENKISEIFKLAYDKNTQKSIETTYNEEIPVMKTIKLYYEVMGEKMPSTEYFEHGFIITSLYKVQIEFVQFDKENYFFFIHTKDEIVKLIYNMVFPFELLFDDKIPKNYIKIQNILFDKSRLFRDYYSIDKFLRQFRKFEQDTYKNNNFEFRKEFHDRLQLNECSYKYYGICINGNLYNFLDGLYKLMKKNTNIQFYPSTLLQNDYVTKIYSCIWSKNQNEGYYLKLYMPRYLMKHD